MRLFLITSTPTKTVTLACDVITNSGGNVVIDVYNPYSDDVRWYSDQQISTVMRLIIENPIIEIHKNEISIEGHLNVNVGDPGRNQILVFRTTER